MNIHRLDSINQDIGRHLKTGEIIWQTKTIPRTNTFSFTEPDHPFINHHWLSELVFYWISEFAGLRALIIFKALTVAIAFFLPFWALRQRIKTWTLLPAGLLAVSVFLDRSDVRPEIFSYLFVSFFIFAIFRAKYSKDTRWLYSLPLIEILWVNFHIYFILGPVLIFLFLIDCGFHEKNWALLSKIILIMASVSLATLVNPNFIKGAIIPFTILKDYGYSVAENQTLFFIVDYGILHRQTIIFDLSLIVLIISFCLAFSKKAKLTFELLTAAVFSILALRMIRNFGLYGLAFLPIVSHNLSYLKTPVFFYRQKVKIIFLAIAAIGLIFLNYKIISNSFYRWLGSGTEFGLGIPKGAAGAVEFVKQNKIAGPVFNNFDVGSFLIWKLYPEQRVFVDGRPEAYSVDFFQNIYKPMQEDPRAWIKYSEFYKINYVLFDYHDITPWAQTFLARISTDSNWPLVYRDQSVVIFVKKLEP